MNSNYVRREVYDQVVEQRDSLRENESLRRRIEWMRRTKREVVEFTIASPHVLSIGDEIVIKATRSGAYVGLHNDKYEIVYVISSIEELPLGPLPIPAVAVVRAYQKMSESEANDESY